ALDGENRYHACFTQGHRCVIVHPSTLAPVLIALDAMVLVVGPKGTRALKVAEFFRAPSSAAEREHVLAPNEMVLWVEIPNTGTRNASYEVRHKKSHDWPAVQAAVRHTAKGGKATELRVVVGHVGPT